MKEIVGSNTKTSDNYFIRNENGGAKKRPNDLLPQDMQEAFYDVYL